VSEPNIRVSVIIPTRNEAQNVGPLVERLAQTLAGTDYELCFVDDSDDDTPEVLQTLQAKYPFVRCHFRTGNQRAGGLSTAVVAGLKDARGEFVCVMDSDLQHPPEVIAQMLKAAESGSADLVVASRYVPGGSGVGLDGFSRRLISRSAAAVARLVFWEARRSTDPLAGFFLCRRRFISGIEFRPIGFKILLELLVCVPEMRVKDIPLEFAAREHGSSKATWRQGVMFLKHMWSLFWHVPGSARAAKFAIVGTSGLVLFLTMLWTLEVVFGWPPLTAFLPAFIFSLAWNTSFNRVWTFADQRRTRGGSSPRAYLERALFSGAVMLITFVALTGNGWFIPGLVSALVAMTINALTNLKRVKQPSVFTKLVVDQGIRSAVAKLSEQIGAEDAYLIPAQATDPRIPTALIHRVISERKPLLTVETASHRPQPRSNVETVSLILVPILQQTEVVAVLACERRSPTPFDATSLEVAMRAADAIAESWHDTAAPFGPSQNATIVKTNA
jgi:dolichol-phosphate mannosyltransferase